MEGAGEDESPLDYTRGARHRLMAGDYLLQPETFTAIWLQQTKQQSRKSARGYPSPPAVQSY